MRVSGRAVRRLSGSVPDDSRPELFPTAQPLDRPSALPVLDSRLRGTIYYEQPARSVINAPESTGMGFWSLNPYVGCEFGCTYCYARYSHRYAVERAGDTGRLDPKAMDPFKGAEWKSFEHRIFVKRRDDVLAALERDLAGFRRRHESSGVEILVIGTSTDPYQPAERRFGVTRAVLERLARERGFSIGIITKSPLITRDIPLLREIQNRHDLQVHISLISTDVRLIKLFEARSPMPHARLRALDRLNSAGVNAGVIVAPVLPGITDTEPCLDALLAATRKAGGKFAHYGPLRLYAAVRAVFLPVVDEHFPTLARRYRAAYSDAGFVPETYRKALSARFHRLAAKHGIMVDHSLRDEAPNAILRTPAREQLALFPPATSR